VLSRCTTNGAHPQLKNTYVMSHVQRVLSLRETVLCGGFGGARLHLFHAGTSTRGVVCVADFFHGIGSPCEGDVEIAHREDETCRACRNWSSNSRRTSQGGAGARHGGDTVLMSKQD
jgi:hypothetical protein